MTEANNNIESVYQQSWHGQNLQENNDKIAPLIELMKNLSISVDTEELDLEIDETSPRIDDMIVSSIVRQVLSKKIQITLCQLLKIVEPEIRQNIINSIANSDSQSENANASITKKRKIPRK